MNTTWNTKNNLRATQSKLNSHLIGALLWGLSESAFAAQTLITNAPGTVASSSVDLLDAKLSQWEVFLGVPHSSVTGLPEGTFQSDDVTKGTPLGLNNDPKKVGEHTYYRK